MSLAEAAVRLGCTTVTVRRRIKDGRLGGVRVGTRVWVAEASLDELVAEEGRWVSAAEAADLVGCSTSVIWAAVGAGAIGRRATRSRAVASLDRRTVEAFRTTRTQAAAAHERAQAAAAGAVEQRRADQGPPADGHVWLDAHTVALMFGVSVGRVRQLAAADRVPHHRSPAGRVWFRRDHAEQVAASRSRRA